MFIQQGSLFPPPSLSVSELSRYLRGLLESDDFLRDIWVQGEISNLSRPASGHVYFTLKDESSALKCVIWKPVATRMKVSLWSGLAIEAHGAISIYERDGQYQLYVDAVRLGGEGALYQEFLRLKARLEAEGLFDLATKKALPERPAGIGIVTSATGAALQDILNTLRRRYPLAGVLLAPCAVQGDEAPPQIVRALECLNEESGVDVILVARGGGSLEDLWAFNDERVVRAVAGSRVPVITGIGHETDFTLADFAADQRAPTPTAAAEMAVPHLDELRSEIEDQSRRLANALRQAAMLERGRLGEKAGRLRMLSPEWRLRNDRQRLDELGGRINTSIVHAMLVLRTEVQGARNRLASLNPFAVLQRGFAMVTDPSGQLIRSVKRVRREDILDVRVSDGSFRSRVVTDPMENNDGGNNEGS